MHGSRTGQPTQNQSDRYKHVELYRQIIFQIYVPLGNLYPEGNIRSSSAWGIVEEIASNEAIMIQNKTLC